MPTKYQVNAPEKDVEEEEEPAKYYNVPDSRLPEDFDEPDGPHDVMRQTSPYRVSDTPATPMRVRNRGKHRKKSKSTRKQVEKSDVYKYKVDDHPPWYMCIFLGFQHYLVMFTGTVTNPLIIAPSLCIAEADYVTKSDLTGTVFVVAGIATFLQATFGCRLPIVQGGTFNFVIPVTAIMSLPQWKCPVPGQPGPQDVSSTAGPGDVMTYANGLMTSNFTGMVDGEPLWKPRIREIQGAIIVASLFQILIGCSGILGFLLRFLGPLAIAPTITLAGMTLFEVAERYASQHWWITLVTVVLIAAFSQYTKNLNIPCFTFSRGTGWSRSGVPIFRLFPVILAVCITWGICAILTLAGVFPKDPSSWGYAAQTNVRVNVLKNAPWFRFPYPGQWGLPTVSAAGVFGILAGVMANLIESIGDYYACARMSQEAPPPMHAVNRGIAVEGVACVLAGLWGSGSGTTSYSENIGMIGINKVASRRVIQCAAIIMLIFGVFGKFGAIFVTIPDPIMGGTFIIMCGMVAAVGISNLQFVDLNSSRNLFIIGFSFFFGLTMPKYLARNQHAISTGSSEVDQIFTVLLRTSMFVGGLVGFVLDNTIPGTDEERGLVMWRHLRKKVSGSRAGYDATYGQKGKQQPRDPMRCYDFPWLTKHLRKYEWTRYVPFLPTFEEDCMTSCWTTKKDVRPSYQSTIEPDGVNPRAEVIDLDGGDDNSENDDYDDTVAV